MKVDVYVNQDDFMSCIEKSTHPAKDILEYLDCSFEPSELLSQKITVNVNKLSNSRLFGLRVLYWVKG